MLKDFIWIIIVPHAQWTDCKWLIQFVKQKEIHYIYASGYLNLQMMKVKQSIK